jgi:serine/threonine kinase 32
VHFSLALLPISQKRSVHLDRLGSFSEDVVRFYAAELSSAIAYLHEKKIIHRYVSPLLYPSAERIQSDLKPDNILLDERGHAHITDFNIAVHYSERRLLTSIAGSMAYMGMPHQPFSMPILL